MVIIIYITWLTLKGKKNTVCKGEKKLQLLKIHINLNHVRFCFACFFLLVLRKILLFSHLNWCVALFATIALGARIRSDKNTSLLRCASGTRKIIQIMNWLIIQSLDELLWKTIQNANQSGNLKGARKKPRRLKLK